MNLSRQLHPGIYAKFDELERRMASDLVAGGEEGTRRREVWGRHNAIWLRTYGRAFGARLLLLVGALGLSTAWDASTAPLVASLGVVGAVGLSVVSLVRFVRQNRRSVSPEEMQNLVGLLTLTPMESLYCEAIVALAGMRHIPEHETTTIASQLNALLDTSSALEKQRGLLASTLGAGRGPLEAEVQELKARLAAATDPVARQTLARSLALCEGRLRSHGELEQQRDRVEAQAEMVAQSFKGLRESLLRLQLAPHALNQPDIAGALQAMSGLHALSTAFEAVAVDEAVGAPARDVVPVGEKA